MAYNESNLKAEVESLRQQLQQLGITATASLDSIIAALAGVNLEFSKAQAACMSFSGQMTSTLPGASMLFGSMKASVQEVTVSVQGLSVSAANAAKTLNTDMYTSIRTGTTATCFFFISPLFYLLYIRDFGRRCGGHSTPAAKTA